MIYLLLRIKHIYDYNNLSYLRTVKDTIKVMRLTPTLQCQIKASRKNFKDNCNLDVNSTFYLTMNIVS